MTKAAKNARRHFPAVSQAGLRLAVTFLVLLSAGPLLAGEPEVTERPDDLASLGAVLRKDLPALREAYAKALEEAGDNRAEIEGAMERSSTRREKLLTIWLVANMRNRVFAERKENEWVRVEDLKTLKAKHLTHTVRYALAARDRFPWCRGLPWDLFLHFVLPYRGSQERAQDYRPVLWKELAPLVSGKEDSAEALHAVNIWASGKVKFERRGGQDLGVLETLEAGKGRCEDMANFLIACASTVGIPCTSAYTPWWPDKDGNHAWNEAYLGGRWRSFMGCEPVKEGDPYDRIKKGSFFGKVYRKRFVPLDGMDPLFGEDVTALYTPVVNVNLEVSRASTGVRLVVWNSGGWRMIARTRSDEANRVTFKDVGARKTALLAAYFEGDAAGLAGGPLLLHPGGELETLKGGPIEKDGEGMKAVRFGGFMPDTSFALLFFDGVQWANLGRVTVSFTGQADFGRVGREKTLYIIVRIFGQQSYPEGRPFLLGFKDGKAIKQKQ